MEALKFSFVVIIALMCGGLVLCMLWAQLCDIFFEVKEKYTVRMIGHLGKALSDAAKQMGGNEND